MPAISGKMKENANNAFNAIKNGKAFKPSDIFLFLGSALFIAVLLAFVIFPKQTEAEGFAVYKSGKLVFTYEYGSSRPAVENEFYENVSFNIEEKTIRVIFGDEYNVIIYDDDAKTVRVNNANCTGKDCTRLTLNPGDGGAIFCAPHELKIVLTRGDDSPIIG